MTHAWGAPRMLLAVLPFGVGQLALGGRAAGPSTHGGTTAFVQEAKLEGQGDSLIQADALFGTVMSLSGDTLVIGATSEDGPSGVNAGAAYVLVRSATPPGWSHQQRLLASDGAARDNFGASVSVSGDTVVVGAPGHDLPGADAAGAAYVFVRSETTWSQQQRLTASDGTTLDLFGGAVAVSGDTVVVRGANAAYVFVRSGTTWTEQQKLTPTDGVSPRAFGHSLALSADTLVVGDPNYDSADLTDIGSAYVFVRSGTAWTEQQRLLASDGAAFHNFGGSISISGDTVVVGATGANGRSGLVYVFVRSGSGWTEQQRLGPSPFSSFVVFGSAVSVSGEMVAVGAWGEDSPGVQNDGAVYVFVRAGSVWSEQGKLKAAGGANGDNLGWAVAAEDGVVVGGAPSHQASGLRSAGAAYAFARAGTVWSEQQKLTAFEGTAGDELGASVSLSGNTLVVGAERGSSRGVPDAGSAYLFVRPLASWILQQKLIASDGTVNDRFGAAVSVSGDTVVVGAPADDSSAGADAGSVWIFVKSSTGWTPRQQLRAADAAANDRFGSSVSVFGDTLVVGAPGGDGPSASNAGSAYVYVFSGTFWTAQQKLTASDGGSQDSFGSSVALSGDTAVIGAPSDGVGAGPGAAYVFLRSGTVWNEQQKLVASDGAGGDAFGGSISISGDTAVVGAHRHDTSGGTEAGAAYVFVRRGTLWSQQQKLVAPDGAGADEFGVSVSISADTLAVGARGQDLPRGPGSGAAYAFGRSGASWSAPRKLTASDGAPFDFFGGSVSISGDAIAVGARGDDTPDGPNAGSAYVFRAPPGADLSLALDDSPDPVDGLQPLAYTVSVANAGPEAAGTVTVTQSLPAGIVFQSAGGAGWTCGQASGVVTCARPSLALGPASPITVTITAPPLAQMLSSTASVTAVESDPMPGDNSDTETTSVTDAPRADLAASKSDGGATAEWGQPLTWTITVSNQGPEPATGATVGDLFPPGVAGVSWTCAASPGSSCPPSGSGDINASVDLAVGGTAGLTATGMVQPGATTVMNRATISPPPTLYDPNSANDRSTTITPPAPVRYHAVTPCRVLDTRPTQTPLLANSTRTFTVGGTCGVPADARGAAANLVAVNPGQGGNLRLYPYGYPVPLASSLNFATGRTRANNAIVPLGAGGQIHVRCDMPPGSTASTHFVLDVVGYFR